MWQASKTQCHAKFASNNAKFYLTTKKEQASQGVTLVWFFCGFHAKRAVRCVILIDKSLILSTIRGSSRSLPPLL